MSIEELVARGGERVVEHAPFGTLTTYRVGGTVRALATLARRADLDELGPLIVASGLPLFVLGNGSNLLVAEGEHQVLGVRLSGEFASLKISDEDGAVVVRLGAGLDLPIAARRLAAEGVGGFEWAVGVPGTVGGAVTMNAGGHGSDMAASIVDVEVWRSAEVSTVPAKDLKLGYRTSSLNTGQLVLSARLGLERGDAVKSQELIRSIVRWRREHQPGGANAGSVFRNPPGDHAGQLIEQAGCKGLRVGSAVVSEKHANFIIADPGGTARDVYELLNQVRARVLVTSGVELRCEHRFIGFEDDR